MTARFARWMRTVALGLTVALVASCAPKTMPPVAVAPSYPDFVYPSVPARLGDAATRDRHDRGWRFLQAGDTAGAEREFAAALQHDRSFYPSEAGLGYVALARPDFKDAVSHFDRALRAASSYAPALVGRGEALLGVGRPDEALKSFESALAVDPSLTAVKRRLDVLTLRSVQNNLDAARKASEQGRYDEAKAAYERAITRSPDSAFLYRDLAGVERKQGATDLALEHFRKAASLDPTDSKALVQVGEILEGRGDGEGALKAYSAAAAIDPSDQLTERMTALRAKADLARLPDEYRSIAAAPLVTRGQLAALIGVRFAALVRASAGRDGIVVTDVRGHWAATWIQAVVRAGVMEAYPNHTFQPAAPVTRGDLAQVLNRLLAFVPDRRTPAGRGASPPSPRITDLPPQHLVYAAASAVVSAGLMSLGDRGAFQAGRNVTGAEAIGALDRFDALVKASRPNKQEQRP